jgi:hypothetical protein
MVRFIYLQFVMLVDNIRAERVAYLDFYGMDRTKADEGLPVDKVEAWNSGFQKYFKYLNRLLVLK